MCILGLSISRTPNARIPFLAVHNRDESLDRPVGPLSQVGPLLCASDALRGGTWMGVNTETGLFVALTNVRSRHDGRSEGNQSGDPPSRGILVRAALEGRACSLPALAAVGEGGTVALGDEYAGFNLVVAHLDGQRAHLVTNRPPLGVAAAAHPTHLQGACPSGTAVVTQIPAGVHALSNTFLDDAHSVKVAWLREELCLALQRLGGDHGVTTTPSASDVQQVLDAVTPLMLRSDALPAKQRGSEWSPLPPKAEEHLQTHIFLSPVRAPSGVGGLYGTRSTTLVFTMAGGTVFHAYATFPAGDGGLGGGSSEPAAGDVTVMDAGGVSWSVRRLPQRCAAE